MFVIYKCMIINNFLCFSLQRIQREFSREECLVETPSQACDGEEAGASKSRTPRRTPSRAATPRRTPRSNVTPGRTPGSRGRRTPEAGVRGVKTGGGRRQLVRMAALRSPFASPNTQNQRLWVFFYLDMRDVIQNVFFDSDCCFCGLLCSECLFLCCNRKFDQDLDSVSSGLRRLKHLSRAFDDLIGRDDR